MVQTSIQTDMHTNFNMSIEKNTNNGTSKKQKPLQKCAKIETLVQTLWLNIH